jgi:hypothetical protein
MYVLPMTQGSMRAIIGASVIPSDEDDEADGEREVFQVDIDGAYLQADRLPGETWVIPPKLMYSKEMESMKQPACPLHHPLYGEEDAGAAFTSHLHRRLIAQGWRQVDSGGGETLYARKSALLGMYVDDGLLGGPRRQCLQYVRELGTVINLKNTEILNHFLGVHAYRVRTEAGYNFVLEQEAYTKLIVNNLEKDLGGKLRVYSTPCLNQQDAEASTGAGEGGLFEATAASHP